MTMVLAGFAIGLASSGHCAGMCGPLVLTIGRSLRPARRAQLRHALLYHTGRIGTYLLLALPFGLAGQALAGHGFGRAIAVLAAALLLFAAAGVARPRALTTVGTTFSSFAARACSRAIGWSHAHVVAGPLLAGAANGLLPCGLVYAAVAAAAATGSLASAVGLMAGFGLGTIPVLLAIAMAAASVPLAVRARLRQFTPVILALTAVVILLRAFSGHAHGMH